MESWTIMNNYWRDRFLWEIYPNNFHDMKRVPKKVPLFCISAKTDTLISDLLISEPHSEKSTLFWEFLDTHGNTICKSGPPGL